MLSAKSKIKLGLETIPKTLEVKYVYIVKSWWEGGHSQSPKYCFLDR